MAKASESYGTCFDQTKLNKYKNNFVWIPTAKISESHKYKNYLVRSLVAKTKLVSWLSIWDFVISKPVPNCSESPLKKRTDALDQKVLHQIFIIILLQKDFSCFKFTKEVFVEGSAYLTDIA